MGEAKEHTILNKNFWEFDSTLSHEIQHDEHVLHWVAEIST